MNPSKKTRKTYEPVDERLLATAGLCFIKEGFGYGIDDILRTSRVAKMSLYTNFGSKYGLIERLLVDSANVWREEIARLSASESVVGNAKVLQLLEFTCRNARNPELRMGLVGQALLEFPLTGEQDETHRKKDSIHAKARSLQSDLLMLIEDLGRMANVANPISVARQILLLANGYLILEPLLGNEAALKITLETATTSLQAQRTPVHPVTEDSHNPLPDIARRPKGRIIRAPVTEDEEFSAADLAMAKVRIIRANAPVTDDEDCTAADESLTEPQKKRTKMRVRH